MSYTRTEVNQFKGLNATAASTHIDDGHARDILNFRMEKIGKLVSRDGYTFGLFGAGHGPSANQSQRLINPNRKYLQNNGIVGIGEMIFSSKWSAIDTDRVMVYMIRSFAVPPNILDWTSTEITRQIMGELHKSHNVSYLFAPLSGKFKDRLLYNYQLLDKTQAQSLDTNDPDYNLIKNFDISIDAQAQGSYENSKVLFAPNKALPEVTNQSRFALSTSGTYDTSDYEYDHWINHYTEINQYRHQLVVSDKINGDTIIEDEANRTDKDACEKPAHALHIRPNCLAEFDIDMVDIDLRDQPDEENSDVKQGMALYKFVLPKMTQVVSGELCTGEFSDIENYPEKVTSANAQNLFDKSKAYYSVMQKIYVKSDNSGFDTQAKIYNDDIQVFTNADNNSEVDNLIGALEFETQEYTDEDGEFKEDAISDVYIWEEYQIPYYICSGKNEGFSFYRELDRMFTKTSNAPRIKELNVKDEYGKQVPLGVWRYRFVWDFGDGVYSAPSVEMNAPDILWSAVPDDAINQSPAVYNRYFEYADTDILKSLLHYEDPDPYDPYSAFRTELYPQLVNMDSNSILTLTSLGKKVFDLKFKLYENLQHRFGVKTAAGYSLNGVVNDVIKPWDILDYADFSTLIVLNPGETAQVKGIFWEGLIFRAKEDVIMQSMWREVITYDIETGLPNGSYNVGYPEELVECEYGDIGLQADGTSDYDLPYLLYDDDYPMKSLDDAVKYRVSNFGYLIVPLFPGKNARSKYSLFDPEGRCRTAYQNTYTTKPNFSIRRQIVFPGRSHILQLGTSVNTKHYVTNNSNSLISSFKHEDIGTLQFANKRVRDGRMGKFGKRINGDSWWSVEEMILINAGINSNDVFMYDGNAYLNIIPQQDSIGTIEGFTGSIVDWDNNENNRPFTILRASTLSRDSFVRTNLVASEAISRLILSGVAEMKVSEPSEKIGLSSEFSYNIRTTFTDPAIVPKSYFSDRATTFGIAKKDESEIRRFASGISEIIPIKIKAHDPDVEIETERNRSYVHFSHGHGDYASITPPLINYMEDPSFANEQMFDNLDVRVYIPGTRFIGVEQLTAYFPSSLLHKAPRLGLRINNEDIPKRAKGIKIFRTLATHSNDWDPLSFGLVDNLKIERDENGNAITKDKDDDSIVYPGVYFFDKVMDENLDFSDNPDTYDGMRRALHSRFNISLNERMYYANFIEIYQSLAPRLSYNNYGITNQLSTNWIVIAGKAGDKGYLTGKTVQYKYLYMNEADQYSTAKTTEEIAVNGTTDGPKAVVLYLLPSQYDVTIRELHVFRAIIDGSPITDSSFKYIGKVVPEDEGIFVDDFKSPGKSLGCTKPEIQTYEDGLRWSEPFQPDWIKLNNFSEYRSGDNRGVRITGIASTAGNLVIFKENSIHRVAVQAEEPPISRTDEVSSNVGCIAPNTLLTIGTTIYFLSSQGFMSFDNNQLQNMDGAFGDELQYILANNSDDYIREASCGYNAYRKEIYLNIPMVPSEYTVQAKIKDYEDWANTNIEDKTIYTDTQNAGQYEDVMTWTDADGDHFAKKHDQEILGHIYIISLEKQYVTKFAYTTTGEVGQPKGYFDVRTIDQRQLIRKYYTNSIGEMRSADIIPRAYGANYADPFIHGDDDPFIWSGIYIETPNITRKPENVFKYFDSHNPINPTDNFVGNTLQLMNDQDVVIDAEAAKEFIALFGVPQPIFPPFKWMPVECEFRSKLFTGNSETVLKRIRKGLVNIFSKGNIKISSISFHDDGYDDRSEHYSKLLKDQLQDFLYPPTVDNFNPYDNLVVVGTNTNILSFIPTSEQQNVLDIVEDRYGKAVRYAIDIRASHRTELNSLVFHWRPIHTYLQ